MTEVATTNSRVISDFNASKIPSMEGKTVIITGANSGIGYIAALELVRKNATVILACRNPQRGQDAEKKIMKLIAEENPSEENKGKAIFMQLDVSEMSNVREFSKRFHEEFDQLHVLINNAGMMTMEHKVTSDGIESQFATNHLGHFLLTHLLMDVLKKSAPARIINVASIAHRHAWMNLDNFPARPRLYNPWNVYGTTKLCNLLFTYELERRLRTNDVQGVIAVACHPGASLTSIFNTTANTAHWTLAWSFRLFQYIPIFHSAEAGALPTLYAATVSNVQGGDYYGPNGFLGLSGAPTLETSNRLSHDLETANKLWQLSEKLANIDFFPSL
jgi:NAD(P)-dependent dehydrogenase (short-subunit alcohol dehydrogenase family)